MASVELLELLTSLTPDAGGGFSTEVPADWTQGRTLYGGVNAALAARSARLAEGDLGPLRALQIAFIAPAAGRLVYVPTVLRRGRSVSFVGVDCLAEDAIAARVTLTYGRGRETVLSHSRLRPPVVPAPEACPEVQVIPAVHPAFFAHMDMRFAAGSPPVSGGEPSFAMWVRHRAATGVDAESAAVAVADVLPPAVLASQSEFRPASSVTWTVDFVEPFPEPDGWYLLQTGSDHAADGYSLQAMSCFDAAGRLVAAGRQTLAYF